ncbi:hypothetical protein CsSME_00037319 [Camellia sinensis var. sinensis]
MWASILLSRELFIGTLNPRAYKCISEVYCPSQFARQFGLTQGIPIPLCSLSNVHLTARDLRVPKIKLEQATFKLLKDLSEFKFTPFIPSGLALKRFQNWWTANMEVHLAIHPHDLLIGLGVPSKAKPTAVEDIPSLSTAAKIVPAALPPPARVTRAALKKERLRKSRKYHHREKKRKKMTISPSDLVEDPHHAQAVEEEHSKEIIIFQRAEKRRQQQLLRDEAAATDATQREIMRRQHTTEYYSLRNSLVIVTTSETSNFLSCLHFLFPNC